MSFDEEYAAMSDRIHDLLDQCIMMVDKMNAQCKSTTGPSTSPPDDEAAAGAVEQPPRHTPAPTGATPGLSMSELRPVEAVDFDGNPDHDVNGIVLLFAGKEFVAERDALRHDPVNIRVDLPVHRPTPPTRCSTECFNDAHKLPRQDSVLGAIDVDYDLALHGFSPGDVSAQGLLYDIPVPRVQMSNNDDGLTSAASTVLAHHLSTMYAHCADVGSATRVFGTVARPNLISWTTLVTGLSQNCMPRDVRAAFAAMCRAGVAPTQLALSSVVRSAAVLVAPRPGVLLHNIGVRLGLDMERFDASNLADRALSTSGGLKEGHFDRSILCCVMKAGFELETVVRKAVSDVYAKSGNGEEFRKPPTLRDGASGAVMPTIVGSNFQDQRATLHVISWAFKFGAGLVTSWFPGIALFFLATHSDGQYEHFNKFGKVVDRLLAEQSGKCIISFGLGDGDQCIEDYFNAWKELLWLELDRPLPVEEDSSAAPTPSTAAILGSKVVVVNGSAGTGAASTVWWHQLSSVSPIKSMATTGLRSIMGMQEDGEECNLGNVSFLPICLGVTAFRPTVLLLLEIKKGKVTVQSYTCCCFLEGLCDMIGICAAPILWIDGEGNALYLDRVVVMELILEPLSNWHGNWGSPSMVLPRAHLHIHGIFFSTTDKPKPLGQLSSLLSDLGLNIREAHVFSTTDGYPLDALAVDGWLVEDTDGLHKALEASTLRKEGLWSGIDPSTSAKSLPFQAKDGGSDIDTRLLKIARKYPLEDGDFRFWGAGKRMQINREAIELAGFFPWIIVLQLDIGSSNIKFGTPEVKLHRLGVKPDFKRGGMSRTWPMGRDAGWTDRP